MPTTMGLSPAEKEPGIFFFPIRGFHYGISKGSLIVDEIFYDQDDPPPPFGFLFLYPYFPLYYKIHRFPFQWKKEMTVVEAEKRSLPIVARYKKDTGNGVQELCIVQRERKDQWYLLHRETHPFELTVLGKDSSELNYIFKFTLIITDLPELLQSFPGGDFLFTFESKIQALLGQKLRKLELEELRGVINQGITDECLKVVEELNGTYFTPHGCHLEEIINQNVTVDTSSIARIEQERELKLTRGKAAIQEEQLKQFKVKTEAEARALEIKGAAETDVLVKRADELGGIKAKNVGLTLAKVLAYQKEKGKIIDQTAVSVAFQHKGVTTLIQNGNAIEKVDPTNELVANAIKEGGGNGNT